MAVLSVSNAIVARIRLEFPTVTTVTVITENSPNFPNGVVPVIASYIWVAHGITLTALINI